MAPIGNVSAFAPSAFIRPDAATALQKNALTPSGPLTGATGTQPSEGFGQVLDTLVSNVTAKQEASKMATRKVLLGESDQLHTSVIAMQEASVAFSMMVEVRNKLVESYQELMRMQV